MAIVRHPVGYAIGDVRFEALAVWDDALAGPRPGVLVAPTFMDRSAFEEEKAEKLAALGYCGFAIDLFGVDVSPKDFDEAGAAMAVLNEDRRLLAERMTEALAQLQALDAVDAGRTAAIGFCFGGKAVLDLARTGAAVAGVATFHGIFDAPDVPTADRIGAKVLAMHGWDDPLAPPEAVLALAKELDGKGAVWELDAYSGTGHGFTNHARPDMYRELADTRSWARAVDFLAELFPA